MTSEEYRSHPLRPALVAALIEFRANRWEAAREILNIALQEQRSVNEPSEMSSHFWGLVGDNSFKLNEIENGFAAYRRAIDFYSEAGCLYFYAYQVAKNARVDDARFALEHLEAASAADWRAFWKHPIHFLKHTLRPGMLHCHFIGKPLTRWRLRRLIRNA